LETRAIRVAPRFVRGVSPIEADIVYQRLGMPDAERCDLVVATNVLLYYGKLEQTLAASNIAAMLAPGGFFLTNTKLDDLAALPLQKVTETATAFSDRPGDGEYVFVYRKPR
jgi:chemotaxis methyl-accepting protein methylase